MIRLRSSRLIAGLMGVMLLVVAMAETNACDRCGLFGRRCRFASQSFDHHEGYGASGGTQTFNFINSYPTPLLAAQGQTVYGYNLSAQAYSVDPALIFDTPVAERYEKAMALLGLQPWMLSPDAGHA